MAKKSRYQLVDRGRKGSPSWYVSRNGNTGVYVAGAKWVAQGYLSRARELERRNPELEALLDKEQKSCAL